MGGRHGAGVTQHDTAPPSWSSSAAILGQGEEGRKWDSASGFVSRNQGVTFLHTPCSAKVCLHPNAALQAELSCNRLLREIQLEAAALALGPRGTAGASAQHSRYHPGRAGRL